jgi:hypothetical protein
MFTASAPRGLQLKPYQEMILAVLIGSLIGLSINFVSPRIIVAVLVIAVIFQWVIKRPEFTLLAMIFFYSTIVSIDMLPLIPIGVGSLNPMDLLLVLFLGVLVLRRIVEPGFRIHITPAAAAIIIFFAFALLSTIVGIITGTTVLNMATTEVRYIGYYLSFLVASYLLDQKQVRTLVIGFFALATVVAVAQVVQAAVGPDVPIIYGRTEGFAQDGVEVDSVTRVIPSGRYLVYVAFTTAPLLIIFAKNRKQALFYGILWLFYSIGIILTFNRNMWLSGGLVYFMYLFALDKPRRMKAIQLYSAAIGTLVALIAAVLILLPGSTPALVLESTIVRFTSIFDDSTYNAEYSQTNTVASLEFRKIEMSYAIPQITPPPLIGKGMGALYRPLLMDILDYEDVDMRSYMHNSHFWVLLKAGLVSYLALIAAFLFMFARGWRWRDAAPVYRPIVLGFAFSLIGILFSALVDPILVDLTWTPVCGAIFGIIEVSFRQDVLATSSAESAISEAS